MFHSLFKAYFQWSVDLPVTIKGRHYVEAPLSPPLSLVSEPASPELSRASLSLKPGENTQGAWIKERFEMPDESSDEETMPTSAVSASSSFGTSHGYSTNAERSSMDTDSRRGSTESPPKNRRLKTINMDDMPAQKPAPTGPLPVPPESPSPVFRYRNSPEQTRPTTAERPRKKQASQKSPEYQPRSARGRDNVQTEVRARSRSVPAPKEKRPAISIYDPFAVSSVPQENVTSTTPEPYSAGSISTKSTMPPTPTAGSEIPSYYHSKPSYYLENSSPKVSRARANTSGSSTQSPISPNTSMPSPSSSPQATRVKFTDPEVLRSPSSPPVHRIPKSPPLPQQAKLPFPRSPPEAGFPFRAISPPPRKNSGTIGIPAMTPISTTNFPTSTSQSLASPVNLSPKSLIPSPPSSPARPSPITLLSSKQDIPSRLSTPKSSPPRSRISVPQSNSSLPTTSRLPTARPPLPSHSKERILSMATETTTSSRSRAPTISTAPTSRSGTSSGNTTRPQLKRRPTNPSLFPPLPPATLAVQQTRLSLKSQGDHGGKGGGQVKNPPRDGQNWI
jgi:hypothetical protein